MAKTRPAMRGNPSDCAIIPIFSIKSARAVAADLIWSSFVTTRLQIWRKIDEVALGTLSDQYVQL
jgi:hypothetical protein